MTKREFWTLVNTTEEAIVVTDEMRDLAKSALASLDKAADYKKSYESKSKQETLERANKVYDALIEMGTPSTCKAIAAKTGYTTQRVSALLKKCGERVSKVYDDKGVALFSAVAAE